MIEIIPMNNTGLFERELSNKEIKRLTVEHYCFAVDMTLISKLITIENRPINNQKLFIRNILEFLSWLDSNEKIMDTGDGQIHTQIFRRFFGNNHTKGYKTILSELEIITAIPHEDGTWFSYNKKNTPENMKVDAVCSRYKVHNTYYAMDEICLVVIPEGRKKYTRDTITIQDGLELDNRYINTIDKIEINTVPAIKGEIEHCIKNNLSLSILQRRISRIFNTKRSRSIKKGGNVSRIYHTFSTISRISRKHLSVNFTSIDIKNCQPLILVGYLMSNELGYDIDYKNDCEDAIFYEKFYDLYSHIQDEEERRLKVKQHIYKFLFFGFTERSRVNKRFKELYPITWQTLSEIKKTDISLANRLQNLEGDLFNKLIPDFSKHYFTLFDAVYFSDSSEIGTLTKRLGELFAGLGLKVRVEIN